MKGRIPCKVSLRKEKREEDRLAELPKVLLLDAEVEEFSDKLEEKVGGECCSLGMEDEEKLRPD